MVKKDKIDFNPLSNTPPLQLVAAKRSEDGYSITPVKGLARKSLNTTHRGESKYVLVHHLSSLRQTQWL